jgi:hypothetical protein
MASRYRRCIGVIGQDDARVVGDQLRGHLHVATREAITLGEQAAQLAEDLLGHGDILRFPLGDDNIVATRPQTDPKGDLERAQVVVE